MRRRSAVVDDPAAVEARVLDEVCEVWRLQLVGEMSAEVAEVRRGELNAQLTGLARLQGWSR